MLYRYVAYESRTGKTLKGTLEAPSEAAAEQLLWQQDCVIITLEEGSARSQAGAASSTSIHRLFPTFFGVRITQVMIFTRHLAALLGAGVGLLPALQVLQEQTGGAFRPVLQEIARAIQSGSPLSDAVARQGSVFPPFYARMVRVGEKSGNLEVVLRQIGTYIEKEHAMRSRIQRAMAYPSFVFLFAILVVVLILSVALPALTSLYVQFSAELPLPTRILIGVTSFVRTNGLILLALVAAVAIISILYAQTDSGRMAIDRALVRLPVVGDINMKSIVARYSRTLSLLLRAGLPLVEIMDLVEATVGNRAARAAFASVRRNLMRGQALSAALAAEPLFPPMLAQMVRVGEETGNLEGNLEAVADLYEDETERAISAMTGALEPAMTIAMGLMVAFIALSTILPIYGILKHIK